MVNFNLVFWESRTRTVDPMVVWFWASVAQWPLAQCWYKVGPPSTTLNQHYFRNVSTCHSRWVWNYPRQVWNPHLIPANTSRWPNAGVMFCQRLTRWNNITSALGQRSCLPGESSCSITADPFTDNLWTSTWYSGYLRIKPDLSGSIVMAFDLFDHNLLQTRGVDPMLNKAGTAAQHCTILHCTAMQCNAIQCNAIQCNAMQFNAMHNRFAIGSHCKTNRFYYTTTTTTDSLLTIFN